MNMGDSEPLLSSLSALAAKKLCALQIRPRAGRYLGALPDYQRRLLCVLPCVCAVGCVCSNFFVGTPFFAFGRPPLAYWSAQCTALVRAGEAWTSHTHLSHPSSCPLNWTQSALIPSVVIRPTGTPKAPQLGARSDRPVSHVSQ